MVIYHQVLFCQVTGWSPPYGDSPSSAVLLWLVDPYHMVINHKVLYYQVLCYHVTGYSPPYSDSPSSAVLSSVWLNLTMRLFTIKCCAITIKCCTIKWLADTYHMVIHYQVLCYHVTGYSPPYSDSPSSAVLSSVWLILTMRLFTKCCAIMWWADSHHTVIHHQVLYYHVTSWTPLYGDSPSSLYYQVTCWSPPYGDSPLSALLSRDRLIPTIWWFIIKFSTFMWLADPYNIVIHHQVLYYAMNAWSTLYHDSLPSTVLSWPNAFFCENVCSKPGTNFPLFLIIIKHLMSYLLVNV